MLRILVLTALAFSCNCQRQLIEVRDGKVVRQESDGVEVSNYGNYDIKSALPISSYVSSALPVSYGLTGFKTLGYNNLGYSNLGLLNNLGYYNNLGLRPVGAQVLSVAPKQRFLAVQQPSLAIAQPALAVAHRQVIAQPAFAVAQRSVIAQPEFAFAQRSVISQPQVAVAIKPQVLTSEAVRPVNAAIHQVGRTVEYQSVAHHDQPIVAQEVVVEPNDQPINIHFRSRSSTVKVTSEHIPGEPGSVVQTSSQDEPTKVVHEVTKPVMQEVREVIQPYRQVTQQIQPVVENVHRVVAQGEGVREQYVAEPVHKQVVQEVRPAYQTIAVKQPVVSVAQPIQSYVSQQKIAALGEFYPQFQQIKFQSIGEPITTSIVRTPIISRYAQPVVGVNRIVSLEEPTISVRHEVNEPVIKVEQRVVRGNDYVKYVETD